MKKFIMIILSLLLNTICGFAYNAQVVDNEKNPIESVDIIFYNSANDSIGHAISGKKGEFIYENNVGFIEFRHHDYEDLKVDVTLDKDAMFFLKPVKELGEFVITAETAKRFLTHDSYIISRKSMKKYVNALHALNEIPFISVEPKGNLQYKGNSNIGIMINGIPATAKEISSLSKDDIAKVDVYSTPPQEFVGQNISAAIDIILKEGITGGNGSIQTSNSINRVWGDNNIAFYYNYKRSRFSVQANNTYRRLWGGSQDQKISHNFGGVDFVKTKVGIDEKSHVNENSFGFTFQNGLKNNYIVNASVTGEINRVNSNNIQNVVTSNGNKYLAYNNSSTPFQRITAAASFRKYLGIDGKNGYVSAMFSWSGNTGKNYSSYQETAPKENATGFFAETSIKQRTNAIYGRADYVSPSKEWGRVTFSIQDSHQVYKELEQTPDFYTRTNWLNIYGTYFVKYKAFYFSVLAGVTHNENFSKAIDRTEKYTRPVVNTKIYYYPSGPFRFDVYYDYGSGGPSLAQRTSVPRWQDNFYVYQGNPALTNYNTHKIGLDGSFSNKYVEVAASLSYSTAPGNIGTLFKYSDEYILETLVNQKEYRSFDTSLSLTLFPLGKRLWSVRGSARWGRIWGENDVYTYHGNNTFYWISSSVNLNKWNFGTSIQLQSEKFNGSSTITRPFTWHIYGYYRPIENISIGIDWSSPFMKHSHEKEWTVKEALVQMNSNYYSKSFANRLSIEFNYYFNFGKRHNDYERAFTGSQAESGVLKRN